ncbi:MAG: TIGR02996 domain-containing protein [Polyangiaceae bacterium]
MGAPKRRARNASLEAAIGNNPDDDSAFTVYADWLIEQGDPLGRWIALHQAMQSDPSAEIGEELASLVETELRDFLPRLEERPEWPAVYVRNGFVRTARISRFGGKVAYAPRLRKLFTYDSVKFLRGLILARGVNNKLTPGMDGGLAMLELAPPTLAALHVGQVLEQRRIAELYLHDVQRLWETLPGLRKLVLDVTELTLAPSTATHLEHLEVWIAKWADQMISSLADVEFPALETLGIHLSVRDLRGLLKSIHAPKVTDLRVGARGRPMLLSEIEAVIEWPGFQNLRRLELNQPVHPDGGSSGAFLHRFDSAFAHLEEVRLVQSRFGQFSAVEGIPPYRVLHPMESERNGDPLKTLWP